MKFAKLTILNQGPVVQSVISLTSSLRVISLTVLGDSIYNILIFFTEKMWVDCKSYSHFFTKKFQHICVSLNVNFNKSLTNDIVSFEQLGPDLYNINAHTKFGKNPLIFTQVKSGNKTKSDVSLADDNWQKLTKFAQ